jgi:hypothetical protein
MRRQDDRRQSLLDKMTYEAWSLVFPEDNFLIRTAIRKRRLALPLKAKNACNPKRLNVSEIVSRR